jgi:hypothetical protein
MANHTHDPHALSHLTSSARYHDYRYASNPFVEGATGEVPLAVEGKCHRGQLLRGFARPIERHRPVDPQWHGDVLAVDQQFDQRLLHTGSGNPLAGSGHTAQRNGDLGLRPRVFAPQPLDHRVESEAGPGCLNDRPHRVHVRVGQVSGDIANLPTVTQRRRRPLLGGETFEQSSELDALIIDTAPDLVGVHRCQSESAIPGAVLDTCTRNS